MAIRISQDEIERVRRDIIARGKIEAPGEEIIEPDDDEPEVIEADPLEDVEEVEELHEDPEDEEPIPVPTERSPAENDRVKALTERLLKGRVEGAQNGRHQAGPAPFGYVRRYSLAGTELVPDPVEADLVRYIFREYLRVRSMKKLVELLDSKGIKTRRGKKWSRAGISWILSNDTYVGRVHFGTVHTRGVHTPLVAPITFNKVQKLIGANDKRKNIRRDVYSDEAITG